MKNVEGNKLIKSHPFYQNPKGINMKLPRYTLSPDILFPEHTESSENDKDTKFITKNPN